jgi:outer membrane biosynthesis protein TonB
MSSDKTPEKQSTQSTPGGARPGAMTMAMQAVQVKPTGPKVLRIGIIQAGKIVEERVIRKRETVSVGSSEKNHFVVLGDGVPSRFELFQLVGNDYILNFTESMSGRVGLPGGVQDLVQLRTSGAARNAGSYFQVKINDNSRGKVVIGNVTLLFQFVTPPPVQPRPQLPAAARAGFVRSIDWVFTAFMVFTFMSMFGFIVYLENADWPIDDGLAAVPEDIAKMIFEEPPPPVEETPQEEAPAEEGPEEVAEAPAPKKESAPAKEQAPGPEKSGPSAEQAVADQTARIAEEAAQAAEALIVGALSSTAGGALADVLAGGAVTGNAQDILSQAMGVGVAKSSSGGDLRTRSGGGSGSGQGGLGGLAKKEGTTGAVGEGGAVAERTVRGSVRTEDIEDQGGSGDFDADTVVRAIKIKLGAIKACYEQGLKKNPSLAGKVTVEFTIQQVGTLTGVKAKENTLGDAEVAACIVGRIASIRFNPGPEGGSVAFSYPFVFSPQN